MLLYCHIPNVVSNDHLENVYRLEVNHTVAQQPEEHVPLAMVLELQGLCIKIN